MSRTDHHTRTAKQSRKQAARRQDVTQVRQPRPAARRTGTRHGAIAAAIREG